MKIISERYDHLDWPKRGTCPKCHSILEANRADTHHDVQKPGDFNVNCPICSMKFVIYSFSAEQEIKKRQEQEKRSPRRPRHRSDSMDPDDPAWDEAWQD